MVSRKFLTRWSQT